MLREVTCGDLFNCCDCGDAQCGCAYCFSCRACDACLEDNDESCENSDYNQ